LVLAGEIRRVIAQDGDLVAAARDTRISIYDGIVTITGTTVTRNDRERLFRAIETVPGIRSIDNRVRATLDRSY
jgi:osmotically-inducible protein OsmY